MVYYLRALSIVMAFYLKERKPYTLELMFLYAQEIEDNVWGCRKFSCHVERTSFFEDKRVNQENVGISLQENENLEMNKDFQKVSEDSCIAETQ